jgi:hypothetical protein
MDQGKVQYTTQIGAELQLTGENSDVDGVTWVQLTDGNWVQSQFLEITGIAPAVPVVGVVLPEIGLNVRTAPSTKNGDVSYVAPIGEELLLTGKVIEAEDLTWYELEDGNWVQTQYVKISN